MGDIQAGLDDTNALHWRMPGGNTVLHARSATPGDETSRCRWPGVLPGRRTFQVVEDFDGARLTMNAFAPEIHGTNTLLHAGLARPGDDETLAAGG